MKRGRCRRHSNILKPMWVSESVSESVSQSVIAINVHWYDCQLIFSICIDLLDVLKYNPHTFLVQATRFTLTITAPNYNCYTIHMLYCITGQAAGASSDSSTADAEIYRGYSQWLDWCVTGGSGCQSGANDHTGTVWYGMVWYGMVWCPISFISCSSNLFVCLLKIYLVHTTVYVPNQTFDALLGSPPLSNDDVSTKTTEDA